MKWFLTRVYLPLSCGGGALVGGHWGALAGADERIINNFSPSGRILWKMIYIPLLTAFGIGLGALFGPLAIPSLAVDKLINRKT